MSYRYDFNGSIITLEAVGLSYNRSAVLCMNNEQNLSLS